MSQDYTNKNLQKVKLQNENFSSSSFAGSDLRGADFTGSNFTGADLSNVKTGVRPVYVVVIFVITLAVSLFSGYVAAKASLAIKEMLNDQKESIRLAGAFSIAFILFALFHDYWKGGTKTLLRVIIPIIIVMTLIALGINWSGLGTGKIALYPVFALLITVVMVYIGTIARAAAGTMSNILFIIVAIAGGMFGKSISGGIGPVILAIACAVLSKRALANAKEFSLLRKVIFFITQTFGTSFRNANLANANFSNSTLYNTDFSGADLTSVNWSNSKKVNCKINDEIITDKKQKKHS